MKTIIPLLAFFVSASFSSLVFASTHYLLQTFDDPTLTNVDQFGSSVALDGNHALIGARIDNTNGSRVGQAHLFDITTGNLLRTFNDPTVTNGDEFGASVALVGNHVLIGAPSDDTKGTDVGQAHLFDATTGNLLQTFDDPTPTNRDGFGGSVALNGNHVLIGASSDDTIRVGSGQAHLFDASTGNLLRTFNDPTLTGGGRFGNSVALDGEHVLIGERSDDTNGTNVGQAHLFDAVTGNLLQTFDDPTVNNGNEFGYSVALEGERALIGERSNDIRGADVGQAHLFDVTTGNLLQTFKDPTPTNGDEFGTSVALDGKHALIGARLDDTNGADVGQAHLFDAATGNLLQTFNDPTVTDVDRFGNFVALDGNHVLIGAPIDDTNGPSVGQAHLFEIVPEPGTGHLLLGASLIAVAYRIR